MDTEADIEHAFNLKRNSLNMLRFATKGLEKVTQGVVVC